MIAAIHTTAFAATNVFIDLLCTPLELHYYESLWEEVVEAINAEEDWLNPAFLTKLPCTDSAIRESLCHNPQ